MQQEFLNMLYVVAAFLAFFVTLRLIAFLSAGAIKDFRRAWAHIRQGEDWLISQVDEEDDRVIQLLTKYSKISAEQLTDALPVIIRAVVDGITRGFDENGSEE